MHPAQRRNRIARPRARSLALALALALAAAAYGGAGSADASEGGSRAGKAARDCRPKPTGEPIVLSTITNLEGVGAKPGVATAARASAAAVNCEGGIQGRPVKILACNGNVADNPNNGTDCARAAVEAGAVASVGKFASDAGVTSVFTEAGIPVLSFPLSSTDFLDAHAWALNSGSPGALAGGVGLAYDKLGAKNVRIVTMDVPGAQAAASFGAKAATARGTELQDLVVLPLDPSADYAPQIAKAVDGTDAIMVAATPDIAARFILGARQAGYTGDIVTTASNISSDWIDQLGKEAGKMLYVGTFYPATSSRPGIKAFNADLRDFAKTKTPRDEFEIAAWLATRIVADVLAKAPSADAASLQAGLANYPVDQGVLPPFTLGVPEPSLGLPRVFTADVQPQRLKKGVVVASGKFVNPLEG